MGPCLVPSSRHLGGRLLLLASLTGSKRRGNFVHCARPRTVASSSRLTSSPARVPDWEREEGRLCPWCPASWLLVHYGCRHPSSSFRHILHVSRVPPERNSLYPSTPYPTPFFVCCSYGRGIARPWKLTTRSLGPVFTSGSDRRPGRPQLFTRDAPSFFHSLTPSQPALMSCLPSHAECVPPTWLTPGLDQGPSLLLPSWYQFWLFHAAPPSKFRRGTEDRPISAGEGSFLPLKCLGPPSTSTPLNSFTSMLLCGHPCRHGRSSIRL